MTHALNFHFPKTDVPRHFKIEVKDDFLSFTHRKVSDYRPSTSFFQKWTAEGPPQDAVNNIAQYWATKYNWKDIERNLNNDFNHFATSVPGNGSHPAPISFHFIHEKSQAAEAIPLLLLHGWTSTHLEWTKVVKKLIQENGRSFHVVAVDLPGFGFSPAPSQPGLGPVEQGVALDSLMQQLGYMQYGIASTDLGWLIAMTMTETVGTNIIGHFTDLFLVQPQASDVARATNGETTEEENEYLAALNEFMSKHFAYAMVQTQKPGLLATVLADSPVSMAAWLWDLKESSTDGYIPSYDEIITDAFMAWIQDPYGSIRSYSLASQAGFPTQRKSDVPTGVTVWGSQKGRFPGLAKFPMTPRSWVERAANVVYYKKHDCGGHYPAWNMPDQWLADVQEFFSQ